MGSGRCGTSALAGALAHSGVFTGFHPMGPTPEMPRGYFEDRTVSDWNNRLLSSVYRYPGLFLGTIPLDLKFPEARDSALGQEIAHLERMFWFQPHAYKDPRFSYTYPFWSNLLRPGTVRLVLFRNPVDFVSSARRLRADHPIIPEDVVKLEAVWENAYQHVLKNDDGSFYYFEHDEIMSGSALPLIEHLLEGKIKPGFIEPKLCHITDALCPDKSWDTYHALKQKARAQR